MYETLMRPHEVSQIPSLKSVRQVGEELKDMAVRREERRLRQIASSRAKRKREEAGDEPDLGGMQEDALSKRVKTGEGEGGKTSTTKVGAGVRKGDDDHDGSANTNAGANLKFATDPEAATDPIEYSNGPAGGGATPNRWVGLANVDGSNSISGDSGDGRPLNVSRVFPEVRGHTSYLTFACLIPFPSSATLRDPRE